MSIRVGSRVFAPRLVPTLVTVALLALLLSLGRWQLHRYAERKALFDAFDRGSDAARITVDAHSPAVPRYQPIEVHGHYDAGRQILITSLSDAAGRVGYEVITPLALAGGGWLLVDRGFVAGTAPAPGAPSAAALAVGDEQRAVRGRAGELPRPGIRLGEPAPLAPPYPVAALFPTHAQIAALLGDSALIESTPVLLLDAREPDGFERDWKPGGFPPLRNLGYAVQWFALALALVIIYVVTNTRRLRPQGTP